MKYEEIMMRCQKISDKKYAKFLMDNGWKYETEEEALSGYERMSKSQNGALLTLEEFLTELRIEVDAASARQLYDILLGLTEKGALSPYDVYLYASFGWCAKCPEAVIAYQIGPKRWAVNNCPETISEERAKALIVSDFGFDASRIKLLGIPYYDATDSNFICFRCGVYDWVMKDGDLHQIYQ